MSQRLQIQGKEVDPSTLRTQSISAAESLGAFKIGPTVEIPNTRDAKSELIQFGDVPGDSVVALHFEDGYQLFCNYENFRKDFPSASRGDLDAGTFTVDPNLGVAGDSRFIGSAILKVFEVFGFRPEKATATALARKVESKLNNGKPGLYGIQLNNGFKLIDRDIDDKKPALLFIHGTGSSCLGAFSALSQRLPVDSGFDFVQGCVDRYDSNIFGFEHRSLTESPVQNALQLANALPANAELHLVTHSRGGMIGDLLTISGLESAPFPGMVDRLFANNPDSGRIQDLIRLLREKQFRITRYVRVASPSRGTTLASRRTDRWVSMILSLLGKAISLVHNPVLDELYDALQEFTLAVAREGLAPSGLPGLAAMMPESPLVMLLNLPTLKTTSDLSVIAGTSTGSNPIFEVIYGISDRFYGGQNDLVVNCASMDGGFRRTSPRLFPDQGPKVNHVHYFANDLTRRALLDGLTRPNDSDGMFKPITQPQVVSIPSRSIPDGKRPIAILIPGLMGSSLKVEKIEVWLNYIELLMGGLNKLEINQANVQPSQLLPEYYQDFRNYLQDTHDVVTFPYDWRLSLNDSAGRLAELIARQLNLADRKQPVRIIAHGLGGLLARLAMVKDAAVWPQIKAHTGGRFLMLGVPNGGSYETLRDLTGQSRLVRQMAWIRSAQTSVDESLKQVRTVISQFPSLLELLPAAALDAAKWAEWAGNNEQMKSIHAMVEPLLVQARATRESLDQAPFDDRMTYVAGTGKDTPVGLAVDTKSVTFLATNEGDGRVSWETGIPKEGGAIYYSRAAHGDLVNNTADFPALVELLENGSTARLPSEPPIAVSSRGPGASAPTHEIKEPIEEILGSDRQFAAMAMGGSTLPVNISMKAPEERISVKVVHGDLAFARYTVAVGHYTGDSIVGAESALDQRLSHRLSAHSQLGVYPSSVGTAEVFLIADPTARPAGAIVIGLGKVGTLTPKDLENTYYNGVIKYALAARECQDDRFKKPGGDGLSTLLIGTMANVMSVDESLIAMLRAVRRANAALTSMDAQTGVVASGFRIRTLEVIDIWEDQAIRSCDALARIADGPDLRGVIEPPTEIEVRDGDLKRYATGTEEDWWSRLRIIQKDSRGPLEFSLITNRARSEMEQLFEPQRADAIIRGSMKETATDRTTSQALFEILVPSRLKDYTPRLRRLVLNVDKNTARYPWELFEDRFQQGGQPLAVMSGLIRQLETETYRPVLMQSEDMTAFVVGNPATTKYPSLPNAETEAREVIRQLENHQIVVTPSIHGAGDDIRRDLYTGSYRILHFAAHGVHEFSTPKEQHPVSGMVIGDDDFVTSASIRQMRPVPELVFLNCCHLGSTTKTGEPLATRYDLLAANLAVEFIDMGVRAVIAAGWAVNDAAASVFATSFYDYFLGGDPFGEAVQKARLATWQKYPNVNTWGAYQCYGDPGYVFKKASPAAGWTGDPVRIWKASQLVVELDNLARRAKLTEREYPNIRKNLEHLRAAKLNPKWWGLAEVLAALARIYAELGDFDAAVENYARAAAADKANLPVAALEQWANLEVRGAFREWLATKDAAVFIEKFEHAVKLLSAALQFGPTLERYGLLGAAFKRKAQVVNGEDQKQAIRDMTEAYKNALPKSATDESQYTNPAANWLIGTIVLHWMNEGNLDEFNKRKAAIDAFIEDARAKARKEPSFWNAVAEPDGRLMKFLADPDNPDGNEAKAIATIYRRAKLEGSSAREVASVLEHLDFIIAMANGANRSEMAKAVSRIKKYVTGSDPQW